MRNATLTLACMFLAAPASAQPDDAPAFELRDGDCVVFVGNTFIERDQLYGYLETMLTARWPDRNITFRNLGWSGDTVWGDARAGFDKAEDGYRRLVEAVASVRPTVVFVGYGLNESFDGRSGQQRFREGLQTLLSDLDKNDPRIVLLTPLARPNIGAVSSESDEHNRNIAGYAEVIREVATERDHTIIDLFRVTETPMTHPQSRRLTENGVHLTAYGYWWLWMATRREFGIPIGGRVHRIGAVGNVYLATALASKVTEFTESTDGFRFEMTQPWLPSSPQPPIDAATERADHLVYIHNLPRGSYAVRIDGAPVKDGHFEVSRENVGVVLPLGNAPDIRQVEELRRAIIEKNRLYFHRWRPQNETYLFGFRKHEQGQNAAEVPKFDPLVAEMEARIATLRVPVKHSYELVREKD